MRWWSRAIGGAAPLFAELLGVAPSWMDGVPLTGELSWGSTLAVVMAW